MRTCQNRLNKTADVACDTSTDNWWEGNGKIRAEVIVMEDMMGVVNMNTILTEAEHHLRSLSTERLRVANDFLAYLQEREENEATTELLNIPGFEAAFQHAVKQADSGDAVRFENARRDV